jgi:hypothetical protein
VHALVDWLSLPPRPCPVPLLQVRFVVLDEADQMLNVGFEKDVETILENVPQVRALRWPPPAAPYAPHRSAGCSHAAVARRTLAPLVHPLPCPLLPFNYTHSSPSVVPL